MLLWRGFAIDSRCRCIGHRLIAIHSVLVHLLIIFTVILGVRQERLEVGESGPKLGDEEEDTAGKRGLVQVDYLQHSLDECLDSADIDVVLE